MLVNPVAGRGRGSAAADVAVERLREFGAHVHVFVGDSVDDMRVRVAAAVASRPDAIAIVGGDGTLALVVDEVLDAGIPLALVPAGTGNDLARSLGLPQDPAQAAELAVRGVPRAVDVGQVESAEGISRFVTIAALGFDARVADRTNRLRYPRGRLRYYLAIVIELIRLRGIDFTVGIDGAEPVAMPGILIAVGNTRSYGGGIPMCPEADPGDGRFDVTHATTIGRARLLRLLPVLLRARHRDRPEVTQFRAERLEIMGGGITVYADGERVGSGRVNFTLLPGRLSVLVPAT